MSGKGHSRYQAHIFICHGKSCSEKSNPHKRKAILKERIKELGLKGQVRVCNSSCFDLCDLSPNIMVYPKGTWYSEVGDEDFNVIMDEILKPHLP